jgi:hypothetical protein
MNKVIMIVSSVLLFACEQQNEGGIAEMAKYAETWVKQQQLFFTERGSLADCELTAYAIPEKSKDFYYECSFEENLAVWTAMNKNKLDNCAAGSKWRLSVSFASKEYGISPELPEAEPCQAITPIFFGNAKKEISEEAIMEQAVADSIAVYQKLEKDPSSAMAELEEESKKWHSSLKRGKVSLETGRKNLVISHSYKAPSSQFFTYRGVKEQLYDQPRLVWTATSKMKMGDCPVGSNWKMFWFCDDCPGSHCRCEGGWSEVPRRCKDITPKSIVEYKDPPQY